MANTRAEAVRILLVEDDDGNALLLQTMLSRERPGAFDIRRADSLSAALQAVAQEGMDVVLLDLGLPDSRGLATFVRLHEAAARTPIIVLSGLDDETLATTAVQQGAQDYIVKGREDGASLARAIRYAIERCRAQQALRDLNAELERRVRERTASLEQALAALRKSEDQVLQTQKLESLGLLAGGIAHDFNNLLTAILGNTEIALMDLAPASPARENLREIEKAARQAADLCRQMLAYSGKGRFVIQTLDLRALITEMKPMLEMAISGKASLRYDFSAALPAIEADATQMRQVIMNLVINASEAIGERNGVISIMIASLECDRATLADTLIPDPAADGTYVCLEVADTGSGMDEAVKTRLFDPFFTTKFAGRGLGLPAVLGIVRGHKGSVKVLSEKGKGTTIRLLFPAAERPADRLAETGGESDGWKGTGTVLLADDEETVRTVGKRLLERLGFRVMTAADGREALDLFRRTELEQRERIACVFLDLTMPHMDGQETFQELRRLRHDVPVILASGFSEQDVTRKFAGKGLTGFVPKPYRMKDLSVQLRAALAQGH